MKKLLLAPLFLVLLAAAGIIWFFLNVQAPSGNRNYKSFLITKGASAGQIGSKLESAGLIKSALAFKIYLQFSGQAGQVQTGEFRLTPSFSLFQIVDQLMHGPAEIWVTIPEGLRREEVAAKFALSLDRDSSFITDFLDVSKADEGMLFPDTYLFPKDASASSVVNKMTKTFSAKTSGLKTSGNLTSEQRLVLASILERETKTDAERPVVAGILVNRLNSGMPLQADATVQYAVGSSRCKSQIANCAWWTPLTKDDLTVNSPYNSYKFVGLPPGPISNPGESSLAAAFSPAETDYVYYIHDTSGQIHYAKTLAEHNANIAKFLH